MKLLQTLTTRRSRHRHTEGDTGYQAHIIQVIEHLGYDAWHNPIEHFVEFLSMHRSRPIRIVHFQDEGYKPFGFWYPLTKIDFIAVLIGQYIHPVMENHVTLHEISHILLGHKPTPFNRTPDAAEMAALMRTRDRLVKDPQDIEAEYMATQIQGRMLKAKEQQRYHEELSSIAGMHTLANQLAFIEPSTNAFDETCS